MQAIKQYAEVENGYVHIKLPVSFTAKSVEIIILEAEKQGEIKSAPRPFKGSLKGSKLTEEDIDTARKEMWGKFAGDMD